MKLELRKIYTLENAASKQLHWLVMMESGAITENIAVLFELP